VHDSKALDGFRRVINFKRKGRDFSPSQAQRKYRSHT
jgi:hypothetical protein